MNTEELKRRFAKHLIDNELNSSDGYAVEWTAAAMSNEAIQLVKNIQEHIDVWAQEPERAIRLIQKEIDAYNKSNEAIERKFSWKEVELMLSAFICEHAPKHSQFESPGTFINNFFNEAGERK